MTFDKDTPDRIYISGRYVFYADDVIFTKPHKQEPRLSQEILPEYIKASKVNALVEALEYYANAQKDLGNGIAVKSLYEYKGTK